MSSRSPGGDSEGATASLGLKVLVRLDHECPNWRGARREGMDVPLDAIRGSVPERSKGNSAAISWIAAASLSRRPPAELTCTLLFAFLLAVVASTIYLSKYTQDFAAFNEAYVSMFTGAVKPSRTCIGVASLPAGSVHVRSLLGRLGLSLTRCLHGRLYSHQD